MDLIEGGISNPITHWYYRHKLWFIEKTLISHPDSAKSLVDIGAGSALFSKELLRKNLVDTVVAVDTGYEQDFIDSKSGIKFCQSSDFSQFTFFLMTDVLEHIEDDLGFLRSIVQQAKSNSQFIITVPALNSLWSNHDVFLKHFRRYNKSQLESLILASGLSIDCCRYTYSTLFPIAYLRRRFFSKRSEGSQLKETNPFVGFLLRAGLFPDKHFSRLAFGVSLFLVAHKGELPTTNR